jgi:hypothetical protein
MKTTKRVLRPERLRRVPEQFSWVDQALVQRHVIDRLEPRAAALYLFLVTVADAQGLSYYGAATLAQRLKLSAEELAAARAQLIALELLAYEAPLYQVLALPAIAVAARPAPGSAASATSPATATPPRPPSREATGGPLVSLADLLGQLERRRARL